MGFVASYETSAEYSQLLAASPLENSEDSGCKYGVQSLLASHEDNDLPECQRW